MRIGYYDNAERRVRFKDILRDYNPEGYRVRVSYPLPFTGTIIKQMRVGYTASPAEFFMVHLDEPILFDVYETTVLGGDPAKADIVHKQLQQFGCLSTDDRGVEVIESLFVQWMHMTAIDIRKGQPLEYIEGSGQPGLHGTRTTFGIAQNVYKNPKNDHTIVEFFLLEPLTWFRAPMAIETDFLKPEHVSKFSTALTSDGIYRDWKEKHLQSLPPGTFSEDREEFILTHPIELAQVKPICDMLQSQEDRTRCLLEASLFHIIPIDLEHHSGVFRPMRLEHTKEAVGGMSKKDFDEWFGRQHS